MKKNKRRGIVTFLSIIAWSLVLALAFAVNVGGDADRAEASTLAVNIEELCKTYTESLLLPGESAGGDTVLDYEDYIDTRFETNNINNPNAGVTDEWIFRIIPRALAEQKKEQFLYIGEEYGFYFDYSTVDDTFFVYLLRHEFDNLSTAGHIVRKITPIYYEKYKYNTVAQTASLQYIVTQEGSSGYYKKYSDVKNVYLKNISFNGLLYNENNYNIEDDDYKAAQDNGGYFIGGSYQFKGVSTQSGKAEFLFEMFKIALGAFGGDKVGAVISVAEAISAMAKNWEGVNSDFRETLTNETDYSFFMDDIDRAAQIEKHGHLIKECLSVLKTPNTVDGVLFGIKGENQYAQFTYYYNFAEQNNKWNTSFDGKVQMDIVEENGNPVGSTVSPIASNIESNAFNSIIYGDHKASLVLDQPQDIYVFPNMRREIVFTAPRNGRYTIESSGNIANRFIADKGETESVGLLNEKLIVTLKAGEVFEFSTVNTWHTHGVYRVEARFTPVEIGLGATKTMSIAPGETEYLAYYPQTKEGFNCTVTTEDDCHVGIASNEFSNIIVSGAASDKTYCVKTCVEGSKYLIGVTNPGESQATVRVALNPPVELQAREVNQLTIGRSGLYRFRARSFNCFFKFALNSSTNVQMEIFDETKAQIFTSQNWQKQIVAHATLYADRYYYISIRNLENTASAQLQIEEAPTALSLGNNSISKSSSHMTLGFLVQATAKYSFQSSAVSTAVYNYDWEPVSPTSGKYALSEGEQYFIVVNGAAARFSVEVTFDHTEERSGTLNESGYRYIKFVPTVTDYFDVEGCDEYSWHDASLTMHQGQLNADMTYYLKIRGAANSTYNIEILQRGREIWLCSTSNLAGGLYFVNINAAGIYIFKTSKANGVTATYNILNSQRQPVQTNISVGNQYYVDLAEGKYYIEIICNNKISLLIKQLNSENDALNTHLMDGIEQTLIFNRMSDNRFVFDCQKTGTYYFMFSYAADEITFDITVTDSALNEVSIQEVTLGEFQDETMHKRYGVSMNLSTDKTYYFHVYYDVSNHPSVSANVLIAIPSLLSDIILDAGNIASNPIRSDAVTIMSERQGVDGASVAMGRTYELKTPGATRYGWVVSKSTQDGICTISGNKITIHFNKANENKVIYLNFIDDSQYVLSLSIRVKLPYYATPEYNQSNGIYSITLKDRTGSTIENESPFQSMVVKMGGLNPVRSTSTSISLVPFMASTWDYISCDVTFAENSKTYSLTVDTLDRNCHVYHLNELTSNSYISYPGQVVIHTYNMQISSKTLIIDKNVLSLVYVGSSKTLTDIKFSFSENQKIYLYLFDFKTRSTTDQSVLDLHKVNQTYLYLNGQNSISGFSSSFLIQAQAVTFSGDGSLSVQGDDGKNGQNGANGADAKNVGATGADGKNGTPGSAGVGALSCTALSKTGSAIINLRGGNGGNGGYGGHGGKGGPGQKSSNISPDNGIKAGNGGKGGKGGKGGNRGVSCTLDVSISGITIHPSYAGRGGDGGNGGDGGDGAHGEVIEIPMNPAYTCVAPSDGGNGGNGGSAGVSGSGGLKSGVTHPRGGNGGKGGNGGNGASVSYPVSGSGGLSLHYSFVDARHGGNGGNGGPGYNGGDGGAGGSGGKGAKGKNGSVFQKVGDGRQGGNSGNGGNGGNSTWSQDNVGSGGAGVAGGAGGNPGTPVLSKNEGNQGPAGAPGAPGDPGIYVPPIDSSCVAQGTLITLADGRVIPVEMLTGNELLLVWNLQTGKFDFAPIMFVDSDQYREYEIIHLYFSDGTEVKVIDEHAFWDINLNQYVFLRSDADQYIGHRFLKQSEDTNGNMISVAVQLVDVKIYTEYTTAWSPVTYGHLCYYVNGMLSMPGATEGLINIFEVDAATMRYDEEVFAEDIAKYGLYTYEEFSAIVPIPREVFDAFNGQYLKVAIGKGLIDLDGIKALVERYASFFSPENVEVSEDPADETDQEFCDDDNQTEQDKRRGCRNGKGKGRRAGHGRDNRRGGNFQ